MANSSEKEVLARVEALREKEKTLQNKLEAEQKKNEELAGRIKAMEQDKVKNLIDGAIEDKRIGEDAREAYTKLAEQDYENTEKVLNKMQGVSRIKNGLEQEGKISKEESEWSFDDYHRKGRLENLKNSNPERYAELFKDKFGFEPKN